MEVEMFLLFLRCTLRKFRCLLMNETFGIGDLFYSKTEQSVLYFESFVKLANYSGITPFK